MFHSEKKFCLINIFFIIYECGFTQGVNACKKLINAERMFVGSDKIKIIVKVPF